MAGMDPTLQKNKARSPPFSLTFNGILGNIKNELQKKTEPAIEGVLLSRNHYLDCSLSYDAFRSHKGSNPRKEMCWVQAKSSSKTLRFRSSVYLRSLLSKGDTR